MVENDPQVAVTDNLSTSEVAIFFGCSNGYARELMMRLKIPKRGKGYPFRRVLLALGLPDTTPTDTPELRKPLLDVPDIAKATEQSEKTVCRMVIGLHRDKSFTNALHVGPRKRLLFKFEADAWKSGTEPMFIRPPQSIHPELQNNKTPKSKSKKKKPRALPEQPPAKTVTNIFMSPDAN